MLLVFVGVCRLSFVVCSLSFGYVVVCSELVLGLVGCLSLVVVRLRSLLVFGFVFLSLCCFFSRCRFFVCVCLCVCLCVLCCLFFLVFFFVSFPLTCWRRVFVVVACGVLLLLVVACCCSLCCCVVLVVQCGLSCMVYRLLLVVVVITCCLLFVVCLCCVVAACSEVAVALCVV